MVMASLNAQLHMWKHGLLKKNELVSQQKSESLLLNLAERAARGSRMSWRMKRKKSTRPGWRRSIRSSPMMTPLRRILTMRLVRRTEVSLCSIHERVFTLPAVVQNFKLLL